MTKDILIKIGLLVAAFFLVVVAGVLSISVVIDKYEAENNSYAEEQQGGARVSNEVPNGTQNFKVEKITVDGKDYIMVTSSQGYCAVCPAMEKK